MTPAADLRAEALDLMHEVGADLSVEFKRPITPEIEAAADVVVTPDVHDTIPIVDGKRYVAWQMSAVDGALARYRRLRDALNERVQSLVGDIAPLSQRPRRAYEDQLAAVEARVLGMGRSAWQMLADARHTQRLEHPVAHIVRERLAGDRLQDVAGQVDAEVGVGVPRAHREPQPRVGDAADVSREGVGV